MQQKLDYYGLKYSSSLRLQNVQKFTEEDFIRDLRPFVTLDKKDKLRKEFIYIKEYVTKKLGD